MKRMIKAPWTRPTPIAAMAVAALGLSLFAVDANAGCRDITAPAKDHESAGFTQTVYRPDILGPANFIRVSDWQETAAIVGLWEFEVHLKGAQNGFPDGFLFDWGLATWHDDGTEIQFSAGRPPSAGDVCMGVWRQVGASKFKLNHIALGLTPPVASGTFIGPAGIRATVTVDPTGNTYTGTYTLTQYLGSPDDGSEFDETNVAATFTAIITAKRVSAD